MCVCMCVQNSHFQTWDKILFFYWTRGLCVNLFGLDACLYHFLLFSFPLPCQKKVVFHALPCPTGVPDIPEKNQVSRDLCSHLYSASDGLVVQPLPDGKIVQWVSVHQSTLPTYERLLLLVSRWEGLSNNASLWNVNMGITTKGNIVEFFRRGQCLTFRGILQFAFAIVK